MFNTGKDGMNEDIVICSAYLPGDGADSTPGKTISDLITFCTESGNPLVLGGDVNAHHTLWGSSDINKRGTDLVEYLATTDLEILNRGNEPTFVTSSRKEVLDVSFATRNFVDRICGWHVSPEESLSDHREIRFSISFSCGQEALFRNPRNTNWEVFTESLSSYMDNLILPPVLDTTEELDLVVDALTDALHSSFVTACPGKINKPKKNHFWNKKLSVLRKECRRLYRFYRMSPDSMRDSNWKSYKYSEMSTFQRSKNQRKTLG